MAKRFLAFLFSVALLLSACSENIENISSSVDEVSEYTGETRYTLISVGKPYTTSAPAYESYSDIFNAQLTDGQTTADNGVHYTDTRMVGYTQSTNYVIDLGEDGKRISAVAVRSLDIYTDGVLVAASARISGSNDGTKFTNLGSVPFETTGDQTVSTAMLKLKEIADYRYIKVLVALKSGAYFYFLDEIQVFACVPEVEKVNPIELAYKSPSAPEPAWKGDETLNKAKPAYTKNVAVGSIYAIKDCEFDPRAPKNNDYLTDNAQTGRLYGEDVWVGLKGVEGKSPSVKITLGEERQDIFAFKVHALGAGYNLKYPDYIDVYNGNDFLGRMYTPYECNNFAYTLILPVYITLSSVSFVFPEGEGIYWIEEIEVIAGSDKEFETQLYPPLNFEKVTEAVYWDESEPNYKAQTNLIKGITQQIASSVYVPKPTASQIAGESNKNAIPSSADFPYLTDGRLARDLYCYSGEWFFSRGGGATDFIYDIGKLSAIKKFNVSVLEQESWGIVRPSGIRIYLSENGEDWYNVSAYDCPKDQVYYSNAKRLEFTYELDFAYVARFVMFRIESATLFVDELECFGVKYISSTARTLDELGKNSIKYYTNQESETLATNENTSIAAGDIAIIYPNTTQIEYLRPMLAYFDTEGNIKDTFMDGLLLCHQGAMPSGNLLFRENNMADWQANFNSTFDGVSGFNAIEELVGEIKQTLSIPNYTVSVYISIPTIYESVTSFGDIDGDGVYESLSTPEDRKKVLDWYLSLCINEFSSRGYKNIKLDGFYWLNEAVIWEVDDAHIITEVGEAVHNHGSNFLWVPYYVAHRYILGQELGFDLVSMQPNYVFDLSSPYYRLTHAPELAKRFGMSIEIEHSYQCLSDPIFARRYMLYLYHGVTEGYINSVHIYYDDLHNFGMMGLSDNPLCRMQYDATYRFAKRDLSVTPEKKDDVVYNTAANSPLTVSMSVEGELSLYTLASGAENGYVSLNQNGVFVYYPNRDFVGTDSFTYTYNNYLGESEECVVVINVE